MLIFDALIARVPSPLTSLCSGTVLVDCFESERATALHYAAANGHEQVRQHIT